MLKTVADPWPGPPATSIMTPRCGPSAGRDSTWSVIAPGTRPVRSSGTTTSEHVTPEAASHAAVLAVAALPPATGLPGRRFDDAEPKTGTCAAARFRPAGWNGATARADSTAAALPPAA